MRLLLASGSPRRAELLTAAGIPFTATPVQADESPLPGERPDAYVRRIALAKADAAAEAACAARDASQSTGAAEATGAADAAEAGGAAGAAGAETVVLTADTTVTIDGLLLGKPSDDRDGARMLRLLSGRTHQVLTAFVLSHAGGRAADLAVTNVTFRPLSDELISWYLASGEPRDKAGAYAIQGLASRFVARLDGSYANVVGLPVDLVWDHLRRLGFPD